MGVYFAYMIDNYRFDCIFVCSIQVERMCLFCSWHEKERFPKVVIVKVQVEIRRFLVVGSDGRNLDFTYFAFRADYFVKVWCASERLSCRFFGHLISNTDFYKRLARHDPVSSNVDGCTAVCFVFSAHTSALESKIFTNLKLFFKK